MHAHRSAYIYHPYTASTDDLIFSDEVVILPVQSQSPEPDAYRLSPASLASHDYFFDSMRGSQFLHDDNKFRLSRFIPHDTDFFCTKEMKDELYSIDTMEEYCQSTLDHYGGPEPESFLSDFDSDSDLEMDEDIRSAIPSVCATARKVKITPLRAVRRSIRRSSLPEPNNVRSAPNEAPSPFLPPAQGTTKAFAAFSLTHKLSIDNLKRMIPPWKTIDPVVDSLATSSLASASSTRRVPTPSEQPGDITIIELHDVTLEAVRLAELMSSKFKFEPAEISTQQSSEMKAQTRRYGHGFIRRRSC